ncbi:hypothetical protein M011DRAFT_311785 [Sporormia fimetaria CBS 119925]|uniref:Uncharacterized protein n=1 Tax=Sporormia fimetaria CBS 119925 TaxID=1340428 RepID=A0A6A6VIC5_9PLEO|nr:hypothetical protein M011DRAFT_311785 [Sporormia fimetaria CBS 119925]
MVSGPTAFLATVAGSRLHARRGSISGLAMFITHPGLISRTWRGKTPHYPTANGAYMLEADGPTPFSCTAVFKACFVPHRCLQRRTLQATARLDSSVFCTPRTHRPSIRLSAERRYRHFGADWLSQEVGANFLVRTTALNPIRLSLRGQCKRYGRCRYLSDENTTPRSGTNIVFADTGDPDWASLCIDTYEFVRSVDPIHGAVQAQP